MIDKDSMYNTPPCWCIYMLGLVLDWLESKGGVAGMEKIKHGKAQMLYDVLDDSRLFHCAARAGFPQRHERHLPHRLRRAGRQVCGREPPSAGFSNLKGHRKVGGMRASIYNAMPIEGVEKLCEFIKHFDQTN